MRQRLPPHAPPAGYLQVCGGDVVHEQREEGVEEVLGGVEGVPPG